MRGKSKICSGITIPGIKILKPVSLILCFMGCSSAFSQDIPSVLVREIIVNKKDSTVRANILVNNPKSNINDDLFYSWYYDDEIHVNKGGYSGNLLHGKCTVFNHVNDLISVGYFYEGMKDGTWKHWHANGNLKMSVQWDKGRREGITCLYDLAGMLTKTEEYKDGKLNGKVTWYDQNGEIRCEQYKNGQRIVPKEKPEKIRENKDENAKTGFPFNLFIKKNAEADSAD